jgi:hypothetical protein
MPFIRISLMRGGFSLGVRTTLDMVPNSQRPKDTDGGEPFDPGFDEAALYTVIRDAVKDALLDVIGTVLLLGIAFILVIAGIQAVFSSISLKTVAIGIGVIAVGVYLAAATLEIIPPIREWF